MKALLSTAIVVIVAALATTTWVRAQSQGDRPPGVDEGSWFAISDTVGLVLIDRSFGRSAIPSDLPRGLARSPQRTAVLMAKVNGLWTRVDLAAPPPIVHPLN